jgi:uncharacterized protein (TIGR00266 family)
MKHTIEYGPAFAWLRVNLQPGEVIEAEAGAMVTRTPQLEMKTRLNAGRGAGIFGFIKAFFVAVLRKLLGGETAFVNDFSGPAGGEVTLAPSLPGEIRHIRLQSGQQSLLVQSGSYLASAGDVQTRLRFAGLRGLFGGEGLFFLESSGSGDLFINAYGGIHEVEVAGSFVIDTGHIVAFDSTLDFKIRGTGGWKALFLSGEGLVCEFSGHGKVYYQSRNVGALVGWISRYLT